MRVLFGDVAGILVLEPFPERINDDAVVDGIQHGKLADMHLIKIIESESGDGTVKVVTVVTDPCEELVHDSGRVSGWHIAHGGHLIKNTIDDDHVFNVFSEVTEALFSVDSDSVVGDFVNDVPSGLVESEFLVWVEFRGVSKPGECRGVVGGEVVVPVLGERSGNVRLDIGDVRHGVVVDVRFDEVVGEELVTCVVVFIKRCFGHV